MSTSIVCETLELSCFLHTAGISIHHRLSLSPVTSVTKSVILLPEVHSMDIGWREELELPPDEPQKPWCNRL
jgi:hypothetical protein